MQASLDFAPRAIAAPPPAIEVAAVRNLRRSEWAVLAFLVYAAIMGAVLPVPPEPAVGVKLFP